MVNLQETSGLPLLLNVQDNILQPAGEITFKELTKVKLDNLRPVLLNASLRYPTDIYTEYCDICLKKHKSVFKRNRLHYNIVFLPSGLLGVEYNKTHIFSPDSDSSEISAIVDVIYGKGSVLVQRVRNKKDLTVETEVDFVAIFKVKKGDRIPIPCKYMYTFINAGPLPFVVGRLFEEDGKIDYRTMRSDQGMSYYVIRKNAREEVVRNPRYKELPALKKQKACDFARKYRLTSKKSIYSQFIHNEQRFKKLLV